MTQGKGYAEVDLGGSGCLRAVACFRSGVLVVFFSLGLLAFPAHSEEPAASQDELTIPGRSPSASPPGLDALLQLPSRYRERPASAVAGADEGEWRRRFLKAERALAEARTALSQNKRELDAIADEGGASQWAVTPPGGSGGGGGASSPTGSPLSFKHREAVRRSREEVEAADRALRELKIEADLAGVPVAWRSVEAPGSSRALPR